MNETLKTIMNRKSVREYENKKIAKEDKLTILNACAAAPSAGNQQMYTIIDVTDEELKKKLVDTCDHQDFIAEADMILVFCADMKKWHDGFESAGASPRKQDVGDLMLSVSDTCIAAQN